MTIHVSGLYLVVLLFVVVTVSCVTRAKMGVLCVEC